VDILSEYKKRGTFIVASSITEAFELALTEERATKTPRCMYITSPAIYNIAKRVYYTHKVASIVTMLCR